MSKEIKERLEKALKEHNDDCILCAFKDTEIAYVLTLLKQQPPAGEFTKQVRLSVQKRESIIAKITNIEILAVIGWIPQLCDRLDRAEAINKDLLAACENGLTTLAVISMPRLDNNVATDADLLKILADSFRAAIAKAKQ